MTIQKKNNSFCCSWRSESKILWTPFFMDTSPIKESNRLLRTVSNNFNQVAHLANSTGKVYETELSDMAQKLNRLWDMQTRLMEKILQTK